MTKRIVIFGTGDGGRKCMEWVRQDPNFFLVAWADNDLKKVGTFIEGVPVISPCILKTFDCDLIFIASMYHQEIKHQLIQDIGLKEDGISVVPATILKGATLMSEAPIGLGMFFVDKISRAMGARSISYYIDHGTLLGLARSGRLIDWDNDIDIAAPAERSEEVAAMIYDEFNGVERGDLIFTVTARFGFLAIPNERIWIKRLIRISSRYKESGVESLSCDIILKHKYNGKRHWLVGETTLISPDIFDGVRKCSSLQGLEVLVPDDCEDYLGLLYGDWRTPVRNWSHDMYGNVYRTN